MVRIADGDRVRACRGQPDEDVVLLTRGDEPRVFGAVGGWVHCVPKAKLTGAD